MKTLFLVRHAHAQKAGFGQDDHDRALTPEGTAEALALGRELAREGRVPSVILSSDSLRTRQTTLLLREGMSEVKGSPDPASQFLQELYQASAEDIVALLAGRSEDSVMVVGHNPCMEEAFETLSGDWGHMHPASCVIISWDIDAWDRLFSRPLPAETHQRHAPRAD